MPVRVQVLGTPTGDVLERLKKCGSSHVEWSTFKAYPHRPDPLAKLLPTASTEAVDLMTRMVAYDVEKRIT